MSSPQAPQQYVTPISNVGSGSGTAFWNAPQGPVVKTIRTWDTGNKIGGAQLSWSDSTQDFKGNAVGNLNEFTFQDGEIVTGLVLNPTQDGQDFCNIRMTTNQGRTFQAGGSGNTGAAKVCAVGSGILIGWSGVSTPNLKGFGLLFWNALKSIDIDSVNYNPSPEGLPDGISPLSLSTGTFSNLGNDPVQFSFQDSVTKTNTSTYSVAVATQWGVSATVSAELFGIGGSTTASWQTTGTKTTTTTTTTDIALQWSLNGSIPSMSSITCLASCFQGVLSAVDFTCNVTLTFIDTTTYTFSTSGVWNNVLFTNVTAQISDVVKLKSSETIAALSEMRNEHALPEPEMKMKTLKENGVLKAPQKVAWKEQNGFTPAEAKTELEELQNGA